MLQDTEEVLEFIFRRPAPPLFQLLSERTLYEVGLSSIDPTGEFVALVILPWASQYDIFFIL